MAHKSKWLLITITIQLLLVAVIFRDVLVHPNNYFFEVGNEAIKNYLIPAYFIKYDNNLHFTGMNYSFGDHAMFTDCQFPLSFPLQFIQHRGVEVVKYVPGIFNLLMLLSFLPCAAFLFLIFKEFNIKGLYAAIFSIGITMLSPQVLRMTAHFSLSYMFYIPMLWYFMLRLLREEKKLKWVLLMILSNLFFGLMHLYYVAIILSFQISFSIIYLIHHLRKKRIPFKNIGLILFSSIFSLFIVQAFISFTDSTNDRTTYPWGFFFNYASFNSLYLPPQSSFLNFMHLRNGFPEGYAYIGIVGWIASILLLTKLVRKGIRKTKHFLIIPEFLRWSFYASLIVFLFSCALPFKLGLEFLVDWLGPLRQFRAIGRFAWIYYYVFSVTGSYCLYQLIRLHSIRRRSWIGYSILILMISGWIVDCYFNINKVKNSIKPYRVANDFMASTEIETALKSVGKVPYDFQAILTLPFVQVGSEKFWFSNDHFWQGIKASYETGLPLIDGYLGRTSISKSLQLIQLVADEKIEKPVTGYWNSQKPILLLVTKGSLTANEKELIAASKFFLETTDKAIYELPLQAFDSPFDSLRRDFFLKKIEMHEIEKNCFTDSINVYVAKKDFVSDSVMFLYKSSFIDSGTIELFNAPIPSTAAIEFEVSVWIKIFYNTWESPILIYRQYAPNGNLLEEKEVSLIANPDNYQNWLRAACVFQLYHTGNIAKIYVKGKNLEVNHFLLRPMTVNIYDDVMKDSSFVLNNYFIPPPF